MDITPDGNALSQSHTFQVLGLNSDVKARLQQIAGIEPTVGWLQCDPDKWNATNDFEGLAGKKRPPMFITTTWRAPDPDNPEKNLHLAGGIWIDIDATAIDTAVAALGKTVVKLLGLDIPQECCSLFASGGKGFHIFIPLGLLRPGDVEGVGIQTARHFPYICREFIMSIVVDGMDMSLYSGGKGHLIRQAAVQRESGAYKVPLAWGSWPGLTGDSYKELCSQPRPWIEPEPVQAAATRATGAWYSAGYKVVKAAEKRAARPTATSTKQQGADRPKIIKLLRAIGPASLDYIDWVRVGAVLKRWGAPDALDLWLAFSKIDKAGFKPGECESKWDGLEGAGIGTLVMIARKGGRS